MGPTQILFEVRPLFRVTRTDIRFQGERLSPQDILRIEHTRHLARSPRLDVLLVVVALGAAAAAAGAGLGLPLALLLGTGVLGAGLGTMYRPGHTVTLHLCDGSERSFSTPDAGQARALRSALRIAQAYHQRPTDRVAVGKLVAG